MQKLIGIIIVTHNSSKHIECLFNSLANQSYTSFILYVLDSNSEDDTLEKIKSINDKLQLKIKINALKENIGFAGGNNKGAEMAIKEGCDYIFILNPDMELHSQCIEKLLEEYNKDPQVGVVGPVLLYGNELAEKKLIQVYGVKADFHSQKKIYLFSNHMLNDTIPESLIADYINGGSMMIRKEVINSAGLFDEDYFMYNDELDFAYRVRSTGYKIAATRNAIIWHHHDWSNTNKQGNNIMYYYGMRNKYLYFIKRRYYSNLFIEAIKDIVFFPVKVRWALRTTGLGFLYYYYLGCWHGLLRKTGRVDITFD